MNKETMLLNVAKATGCKTKETCVGGILHRCSGGKDVFWNLLESSVGCADIKAFAVEEV